MKLKAVFLLFLLILPFGSQATTLHGLYEVTVPVESQGSKARQAAIVQAFDLLLVRITGDKTAPQRPELAELKERAAALVRQFRYEREEIMLPATETEEARPDFRQLIRLVFDESTLNEALWAKKLPVWSKTRPAVLVWMAVQDGGMRKLFDPNEPSELLDGLKQQAALRGLPLMFPLMDLEDQINITANDVWAGFTDSINAASARYQPEAILVGRLGRDAFGGWLVRWTLYQNGESKVWMAPAENMSEIAVNGIDGVADKLASRYAQVSDDEAGVYLLEITDVGGVQDYVRASNYLASLSPVSEVQVAVVKPRQVVYKLRLRGELKNLETAISLGSVLKSAQSERFSQRQLKYRLQP